MALTGTPRHDSRLESVGDTSTVSPADVMPHPTTASNGQGAPSKDGISPNSETISETRDPTVEGIARESRH